VSLMNSILDDLGVDYVECITNATSETIDDLTYQNAKTALDTAKSENTMSAVLEAETAIGKISDETTKSSMESELETIKQGIIDEEKSKQEEEEEKNKVNSGSSSGTSGSSSNSSTHLSSGTEGDYFAPIQGVTFSLGSSGTTSGCSNKVSHDLSGVAEGTPIYAGIDGTAKFMQTTSSKVVSGKTVLTSYGNQVRITASDGTYIIYAHLQKFVDGVNAPITETCPKKSDGSEPCSADTYASGTTTVDTKEVKKGDLIGYVGNTGNSTGTHLHVEIHEKGSKKCNTDPWKDFGMH
jgi:murein DD-endopeptidase MepM/ murein hydrolase activator NlpD